jgi:hypothetical protein
MSFHRPAPINQFFRLDYDEVHDRYVKTTPWNNVVHGHDFDSENCMASEGAVAIDAHTGGRIRTSPAGIRNWQSDFSGGIGVDDVQDAWQRHFGQVLWTPRGFSWADALYAIRQRRHVAFAVDYRDYPYPLQVNHAFDHALGGDAYRSSDGEILVFDSLGTGARWLPQAGVRRAAEKLAIREGRSAGDLFVGITAIRPLLGVARYRCVITGHVTTYSKPGGKAVGAITLASYICDRSKIDGLWWYQIVSKTDGSKTARAGLWFKPNRYVKAYVV